MLPKKRDNRAALVDQATALLAQSVKSIIADDTVKDKNSMLAKSFGQFLHHVHKNLDVTGGDIDDPIGGYQPDPANRTQELSDDADSNDRDDDDRDDDDPTDKRKDKTMTDPLRRLKSLDAVAICKRMSSEGDAFGLSEHDLVALIDTYAKAHGSTFAKLFSAQDDTGLALRKAVDIAKHQQWLSGTSTISKMATSQPRVVGGEAARSVGNPKAALAALQDLVDEQRRSNPTLTEAGAWDKVYADPKNAELVQRERHENRPVAAW
jgi:hypothetical protein